jgi:hypothetical protein
MSWHSGCLRALVAASSLSPRRRRQYDSVGAGAEDEAAGREDIRISVGVADLDNQLAVVEAQVVLLIRVGSRSSTSSPRPRSSRCPGSSVA